MREETADLVACECGVSAVLGRADQIVDRASESRFAITSAARAMTLRAASGGR